MYPAIIDLPFEIIFLKIIELLFSLGVGARLICHLPFKKREEKKQANTILTSGIYHFGSGLITELTICISKVSDFSSYNLLINDI